MASNRKRPKISVDPAIVFSFAEEYSIAANELRKYVHARLKPKSPMRFSATQAAIIVPAATLEAIATELYLKTLLVMDSGIVEQGHNIELLFKSLKPGTQSAVRAIYEVNLKTQPDAVHFAKTHPRMPMGLNHCLKLSAKTFEAIRYIYERPAVEIVAWAILPISFRQTILATNPAWANPKAPYPNAPTFPTR